MEFVSDTTVMFRLNVLLNVIYNQNSLKCFTQKFAVNDRYKKNR